MTVPSAATSPVTGPASTAVPPVSVIGPWLVAPCWMGTTLPVAAPRLITPGARR